MEKAYIRMEQSHSMRRKCQGAGECAVAEIGNAGFCAGFVPFIDKVISMKVLGHRRVECSHLPVMYSSPDCRERKTERLLIYAVTP